MSLQKGGKQELPDVTEGSLMMMIMIMIMMMMVMVIVMVVMLLNLSRWL